MLQAGSCHASGQVAGRCRAVTDFLTEDGTTANFSSQTKWAAECRHPGSRARKRKMMPDPSRLLAGEDCAAPQAGEERDT